MRLLTKTRYINPLLVLLLFSGKVTLRTDEHRTNSREEVTFDNERKTFSEVDERSLVVGSRRVEMRSASVLATVDHTVTGQLADTPTRGLPTRGLDDSRTGHLADW